MYWAQSLICLICLAAMLSSPLSAQERTTLSPSSRQRIANIDRLLILAEQDLRTVRQQLETSRQLNEESERDWIERENAWRDEESRLTSEIAAESQTIRIDRQRPCRNLPAMAMASKNTQPVTTHHHQVNRPVSGSKNTLPQLMSR